MGFFVDGVWQEDTAANRHERGRFMRTPSVYRNWITEDGSAGPSGDGGFAAAPGRYHLYVSNSCFFFHFSYSTFFNSFVFI